MMIFKLQVSVQEYMVRLEEYYGAKNNGHHVSDLQYWRHVLHGNCTSADHPPGPFPPELLEKRSHQGASIP